MGKKKSKRRASNLNETTVQYDGVVENKESRLPNETEDVGMASNSCDVTVRVVTKKIKWWEKIIYCLAKNILEQKEQQIDHLNDELFKLKEEYNILEKKYNDLSTDIPNREIEEKNKGREIEKQDLLNSLKSLFTETKESMTIEDALRQITEALKRYKAESLDARKGIDSMQNAINEAKAQRVQYEREANAFKSKFDEVSKRIAEIEGTDKGELVVRIEQTQASLVEQQNLVVERDKQIGEFKIAKTKAEDLIVSLQRDLNEERTAHRVTKEECHTKVDELKAIHRSVLETKDKEYAEKVCKLKDEHQTEINKAKMDFIKELRKTEEVYRDELKKKEDALNRTINTQNNTIATLEGKLQLEANLLRSEAEKAAERLYTFLKGNEIMVACSDDYKEKVEEKLQDVIYEAKQMYQVIKEISQVKTPSEWVGALTKYFISQIEENTSLLNRILKYYAMSNVPFMLDAERKNGIYFVRNNMTQAYRDIVPLLFQCGITPIIPFAFVETKDEGLYEVAGQFNDIESFCPGNMSEHINHIERSSKDLADVITGIIRVGYVIKNEKAQIITQ